MSPVELRTGRSVLWGYDDRKVKSSYIYEFNGSDSGRRADQDHPLTMRQWKMLQFESFINLYLRRIQLIFLLECHAQVV